MRLENELAATAPSRRARRKSLMVEHLLASGMGCCALRHVQVAQLMQSTLLHFDGSKYRLYGWCIMPNHVHVLIRTQVPLPGIMQSWKSYVGRRAMAWNQELGLKIPGAGLWMRDYWDRSIRDGRHYNAVLYYIHQNPVVAGLCRNAEDWPWSSAGVSWENSQ